MKRTLALLLPLVGALAMAAPAHALDMHASGSQLMPAAQTDSSEFSSVVRKKKKRVVVVRPVEHRAYGWRGADPSFDQYGRRYQPPEYLAGCALDLGYGRWQSCNEISR